MFVNAADIARLRAQRWKPDLMLHDFVRCEVFYRVIVWNVKQRQSQRNPLEIKWFIEVQSWCCPRCLN